MTDTECTCTSTTQIILSHAHGKPTNADDCPIHQPQQQRQHVALNDAEGLAGLLGIPLERSARAVITDALHPGRPDAG